jgi:hypothetical protein
MEILCKAQRVSLCISIAVCPGYENSSSEDTRVLCLVEMEVSRQKKATFPSYDAL